MEINMIGIVTTKFASMKQFYQDVIGLPVLLEMEQYVEFQHPHVRFAITTNDIMAKATGHASFSEKKQGQVLELAFAVENPEAVDTTYARITREGAQPVNAPADMPWNQRAAFFADPDGNIHELFADLPADQS